MRVKVHTPLEKLFIQVVNAVNTFKKRNQSITVANMRKELEIPADKSKINFITQFLEDLRIAGFLIVIKEKPKRYFAKDEIGAMEIVEGMEQRFEREYVFEKDGDNIDIMRKPEQVDHPPLPIWIDKIRKDGVGLFEKRILQYLEKSDSTARDLAEKIPEIHVVTIINKLKLLEKLGYITHFEYDRGEVNYVWCLEAFLEGR